ncbi:MAG: hypothetical protein ACE5LB_13575 [Acidiferrobacterales bacterium]
MDALFDNLFGSLAALPVFVRSVIGLGVLVIAGIVADLIVKRFFIRLVQRAARRTDVKWDDALLEHNVFGRLAQAVPALVIFFGVGLVPHWARRYPS